MKAVLYPEIKRCIHALESPNFDEAAGGIRGHTQIRYYVLCLRYSGYLPPDMIHDYGPVNASPKVIDSLEKEPIDAKEVYSTFLERFNLKNREGENRVRD
jgi:hypothetical protein